MCNEGTMEHTHSYVSSSLGKWLCTCRFLSYLFLFTKPLSEAWLWNILKLYAKTMLAHSIFVTRAVHLLAYVTLYTYHTVPLDKRLALFSPLSIPVPPSSPSYKVQHLDSSLWIFPSILFDILSVWTLLISPCKFAAHIGIYPYHDLEDQTCPSVSSFSCTSHIHPTGTPLSFR